MPVRDEDGRVIGAVAASGATVSPFFPAELDRALSVVDGRPANPEDQVIAHALGVPYVGQHGDDLPRWEARYGAWRTVPRSEPGTPPAPRSSPAGPRPRAVELADAGALRRRAGRRRGGRPPRRGGARWTAADAAPTGAAYMAEGVAAAAALFGRPSGEVADLVAAGRHVLPVPVVALGGGLPLPGGGAWASAAGRPGRCARARRRGPCA